MKIFYLDTSSSFLYCGLIEDNQVLFEIKKQFDKDLSKYTLSLIQEQFNKNQISPKTVDKIILVNGPGSFTGVRIAITICKTFAWSLNIPITTISSLQAMAVSNSNKCDFIVPLIDARRGFVYSAVYDSNYNIVLKEQYIKLDILLIALEKLGDNYVFVSNDKFEMNTIKYDPDILKIVNTYKDKESVNVHSIDANYLKLTEAEEKINDISNK